MDENKIILDILDRYHAGEILEVDFQKRVENDSDLKKAYIQYQRDLAVIHAGAKEQLKKKAELALKEHELKKATIFPLKRLLQVAASVTLLVASIFLIKNFNSNLSSTAIYSAHFVLPDAAGERGANPLSDAWNNAMIAYSNKDFTKTISLLNPILNQKDFPFTNRGHLYLGLSHLMLNEDKRAIMNFEAVDSESSFVQDAEWYKALTYLKIDNLEQSKIALEKITEQPRHYKYQEALEILKQLQ